LVKQVVDKVNMKTIHEVADAIRQNLKNCEWFRFLGTQQGKIVVYVKKNNHVVDESYFEIIDGHKIVVKEVDEFRNFGKTSS
jgi:hypothetical protein